MSSFRCGDPRARGNSSIAFFTQFRHAANQSAFTPSFPALIDQSRIFSASSKIRSRGKPCSKAQSPIAFGRTHSDDRRVPFGRGSAFAFESEPTELSVNDDLSVCNSSVSVSVGVAVGVEALPSGMDVVLFSLMFLRFVQPLEAFLLCSCEKSDASLIVS